jgi:replication factor C small subunit
MENVNSLWCEFYRPKNLEEYIGNETLKSSLKTYMEKGDIPHLLLYGPPGTGKTSAAKIIVKSIECDYIYINASDESGIETVRTKMKDFASTCGFKPLKIIVLDEADRISPEGQYALRNMMETFSLTTRFILTCNYVGKITSAIQSRCQSFEVVPPSKREIAAKLVKILDAETIKYDIKDVAFVVNTFYSDIRKIINYAQQSSINGELKISSESTANVDFKNKLLELLKTPGRSGVFNEIRQLLEDSDVGTYESVYEYLFNKVDELTKTKVDLVVIELADSLAKSALLFDNTKNIMFLACMIRLLRILTK